MAEGWTQLRLPRLLDDDPVDGASRWSFAIVTVERTGRVTLPAAARAAMKPCVTLRLSTRGEVVVLLNGGAGRTVALDGRGRLVVPRWLAEAADPAAGLLVATHIDHDGAPVMVLAPPRLLVGMVEALVGECS